MRLIDELFDRPSYLRLNPDVAVAAAMGKDPLSHFMAFGMAEGRSPSLFFDIPHVVSRLNALGRAVAPGEALAGFAALPVKRRFVPNRWFCPWSFIHRYGERFGQIAGLSDYELFLFYLEHCRDEALSPSPLFQEELYRRAYSNWQGGETDGLRCGFLHFLLEGAALGHANLPGYGNWLMAGALDQVGFLLAGGVEQPSPFWFFDEEFYATVYHDVHALTRAGIIGSGLAHFIAKGCRERRTPHPAAGEEVGRFGEEDGWAFLQRMAMRQPPPGGKISLGAARRLRDRLLPQVGEEGHNRVTEAIWPFVKSAMGLAPVETWAYAQMNPDVAETLGRNPETLQAHWRDYGFAEGRQAPGTDIFGARKLVGLEALLNWRDGVNFIGPLSSASGLGNAARGYLAALRETGAPVAAFDVSGLLNPAYKLDLIDVESLTYSINLLFLNADQVLPFVRRYGTSCLDNKANVGAWVWESFSPRAEWRAALGAFDLLIAPSRLVKDSFALFTDTPIEVVPYALDEPALRAAAQQPAREPAVQRLEAAKAAGKRIALFVMDASSYTARKGLDLFERLAAQVRAEGRDDWLFVLKTHARDYSLREPGHCRRDEVVVIDVAMEFGDLCRLKGLADIYLSPHRSEGFGLNIFESLLLGVPVLCSPVGGAEDLLGPNDPMLLPGRLKEIGRDIGPYRKEAIWFEPDYETLAAKFLAFADAAARVPEARRQALEERLSLAAIGAGLVAAISAHCGYVHPGAPAPLERFLPLCKAKGQELFTVSLPAGLPDTARRALLMDALAATARPFFSILTPTYDSDPAWLEALYQDLIAQEFPGWEWCISDDASTRPETLSCLRDLRRRDARILVRFGQENLGISGNTNAAARIASGRYLVMIDHDDRVSPLLLATYRTWINQSDAPMLLYCDEDKINEDGSRTEDYFKPDFSPEHLLSSMYLLHCLCVEKAEFLRLGGYRHEFSGAQDHEFVLRATGEGLPALHVDRLLYSWRKTEGSAAQDNAAKSYAMERGRQAVAAQLARLRVQGEVEHGVVPGTYRVRPALPPDRVSVNLLFSPPKVTEVPLARLAALLEDLNASPPAQDYELRIVADPQFAADLTALREKAPPLKHVACEAGLLGEDFAALANCAVRSASAERIVLLDGGLRRLEPGWLEALMEMLELPGVGIAGGRLLYPDGTFAHAGIVLGVGGLYGNLFERMRGENAGYNCFAKVIRNFSAVSGAMMAFRASSFARTGGFDSSLPAELAAIDFCLQAGEAGLRTVYTPFAGGEREAHNAFAPRADRVDVQRFLRKWRHKVERDPYYNINLTRVGLYCEGR